MNFSPADRVFMARAIELTQRGRDTATPNPNVGCVIVKDGIIVGEGWHERAGEAHAEVKALAQAGASAKGGTAYVTLEPCAHQGRTGPCTDVLVKAGVSRVVAAIEDPFPQVDGRGFEKLRDAGIKAEVGLMADEAREVHKGFLARVTRGRPWMRLKAAASLDGRIALANGESRWITSEAARRDVHMLRARSSAMLTGIGTVLRDDPELTVRHGTPPRVPPLRVVFDSSARLPLGSRLASTARDVPVAVVCHRPDPARAAALEGAGVTLIEAATAREALVALRARGVRSLLVEGGATLAAAFIRDALVDRLVIFRAPLVLGAGSLNAFGTVEPVRAADAPRWRLVESRRFEDDEMTVYAPPD